MKKTNLAKMAKVMLSTLVMGGLLAAPVSAATTIPTSGIANENVDSTVVIGKDLAIYNKGYNKSYSPNITYTFAISSGNPNGATVNDGSRTMAVTAGDMDAVSNAQSNVVFTAQECVDTDEDLATFVRGNIEFSFNVGEFDAPGIYRYVITDTTSADTLRNAGVVRPSDYEDTRNLDVYVIANPNYTPGGQGSETPYVINGYVLTDMEVTESITGPTDKDPGFRSIIETPVTLEIPGTSGTDVTPPTPGQQTVDVTDGHSGISGDNAFDYYYSYNLTVSKEITGNMADMTHAFQFNAAITNAPATTTVDNHFYAQGVNGAITNADPVAFNLGHGASYTIYGLNPYMLATITETNDTASSYKVSTSDNVLDQVNTAPGATAADSNIAVSNYATANASGMPSTAATGVTPLTFTNNLESLPPTGVMLVVAPFIIVAALIGVAFGVSKIKVKKNTTAENSDAE